MLAELFLTAQVKCSTDVLLSYYVIKETDHKDVAHRGICNEPDKAGERNLLGMVEIVPGVTDRNVRALTGVFRDTSPSLAQAESLQQV